MTEAESMKSDFEKGYPVLKFGSRQDFERAILEARWLADKQGKMSPIMDQVASKYLFPPEFLESGLTHPSQESDLIKVSAWWPILYSWFEQEDEERNLVRRPAAYRAKAWWDLVTYPFIGIITVFVAFVTLNNLPLALSASSITAGVVVALYRRKEDWDERLEEAIRLAKLHGYPDVADYFIELARKNPLFSYYSYKRDLEVRPRRIVLRSAGSIKETEQRETPVFIFEENPDQEYVRRIDVLRQNESKTTESQS